jgi:hypothetical protein
MEFLDDKLFVFQSARDDRFKFRFRRERIEAEHLEQLLAILSAFHLPIVRGFDFGQRLILQLRRFKCEVAREELITPLRINVWLGGSKDRDSEQGEERRARGEKRNSLRHDDIPKRAKTCRRQPIPS